MYTNTCPNPFKVQACPPFKVSGKEGEKVLLKFIFS